MLRKTHTFRKLDNQEGDKEDKFSPISQKNDIRLRETLYSDEISLFTNINNLLSIFVIHMPQNYRAGILLP